MPCTREQDGKETWLSKTWKNLRKNFASEGSCQKVQIPRSVQTCRGKFVFPCADGSIKQEGHAVPTLLDHFNKTMRMQEETASLKGTLNFPMMREETLSQVIQYLRHLELPSVRQQRRRTNSGAFHAHSVTVTTLHLAVRDL